MFGVVLDGDGESGICVLVAVFLVVLQAELVVDGCDPGPDSRVCTIELRCLMVVGQRKVQLLKSEETVYMGTETMK